MASTGVNVDLEGGRDDDEAKKCCEGEGGFCCVTECRLMREEGRAYPLLCALGILVTGMYFNCCMQVILHQNLDPFYEVPPLFFSLVAPNDHMKAPSYPRQM